MFVSEQHTRHLLAGIICQFNIDFIIYFICLSQVFRHGNPISCAHYTTKIKHDVLSLYVELMLGQGQHLVFAGYDNYAYTQCKLKIYRIAIFYTRQSILSTVTIFLL